MLNKIRGNHDFVNLMVCRTSNITCGYLQNFINDFNLVTLISNECVQRDTMC